MTAIVANHEMVVSDACVTYGSTKFSTPKIEVVRGCIVAGAGAQKPFELFCEAFAKVGPDKALPVIPKDWRSGSDAGLDFEGLVLRPDGRLFLIDWEFARTEITNTHFAIGCGAGAVLSVLAYIKKKGGEVNRQAMCDAIEATAEEVSGVSLPLQIVTLAEIAPTKTTNRRKRK